MYLIQLLLPLYDNDKRPFARVEFDRVRAELVACFGGVTAYLRAPAHGAWEAGDGEVSHDDVVILEVMAEQLDREWWRAFRTRLERHFQQDELVVRAHAIERL